MSHVAHNEKMKVAITSIVASFSLALFKLIIAISTNSLGLFSEAMHSGLDVIAAVMTLYAVRMARKPPDLEHNYGYAKFESLTSLGEVLLLFIIAGWIFYEGIERIFFRQIVPEVGIFSFIVLVTSIIVDYWRSKTLYKIANKYGSQAMESDALHFKTDMLTSSIVIVGLAIVYLFGIPYADAYSAIIIAGLIIYTSLGLGRRTFDVLLDKAPKGIQGQIVESIMGFDGVKRAHSVRVRKVGMETFVDLHIEVPRTYTHEKAHKIATNVENKIKNDILPNSDVVVHVDAIEDSVTETIKDKIRLISSDFPSIKNIHSIYLSDIAISDEFDQQKRSDREIETFKSSSSLHLYLDVQMENTLDFNTAHSVVDDFENNIKKTIPNIKRITTHMEIEQDVESSIGHEEFVDQTYFEKIKKISMSVSGVSDCKDVHLVYLNNELHITLTIKIKQSLVMHDNTLDNIKIDNGYRNLSLEKAHQIVTLVQNRLIESTGAARVIIHAEPD